MKDYLGNEASVGDIIIGCYGGKYNRLVKQRIVKITKCTVQTESLNDNENCLAPNRKYLSDQFLILEKGNKYEESEKI